MEKEPLGLATKDSQLKLLQQVLQAQDQDAEEEDVKEELMEGSRDAKVSESGDIWKSFPSNEEQFSN